MKNVFVSIFFSLLVFGSGISVAQAQLSGPLYNNITSQDTQFATDATYDTTDASGENTFLIIAQIIYVALSLLAVIFLVLIVMAGYNWMTASGDEEKVKKAGSTIRTAVIGLIIILGAYAITYFIFDQVPLGIGTATS